MSSSPQPGLTQTIHSQAYKRYITVVLLVIYIFNQTDRAIFGILMEPIKREIGLSDSQLGFLAGPALALFYATLGIPIARWADRSHRVNIMTGAIVLWSCIVMLSAAVVKFSHLALARIGVGIGEAGFSAVAQSVIADYHTPAERTRAVSIFMLAIPLGGALSNIMGGWINQEFGWRVAFIAAGLPGLLLALVLKFTVREPIRVMAAAEKNEEQPPLAAVISTMWERASLRHVALAAGLMNLVAVALIGWAATFFIRIHGMSTGELGVWLAVNSGIGGGLGIWLSGSLTRRTRVEGEVAQARVLAGSAVLAFVLSVGVLLWPDKTGGLVLLFLATAVLHFFYAPSFALVQGLAGPRMRATMLAIVIFLQLIFGSLVGWQLIGVLSDVLSASTGVQALRWAMVMITPMAIWAGVHFWFASRTIRQDLRDITSGQSAGHPSPPAADPYPNRSG